MFGCRTGRVPMNEGILIAGTEVAGTVSDAPLDTSLSETKSTGQSVEHQAQLKELNGFLKEFCEHEKAWRLGEALEILRKAIIKYPYSAALHFNLTEIFKKQGRQREAISTARRTLRLDPANTQIYNSLLFTLHYLEESKPEELFEMINSYSRMHFHETDLVPRHLLAPVRNRKRIRIAFASPDFRRHSVTHFIEPVMKHLNRSRFEIFGYSYSRNPLDQFTDILKSYCETWRDFKSEDFESMAKEILEDKPDIFVDLAGHSADNVLPLLAARMAPIQCTYLGYPNTTGLKTVDYRIVDVHTDPPGLTEKISTEKLIRLPESMWCFNPLTEVDFDPIPPHEKVGYFTFGTFNYLPKLNDTHLRRWAKLLRKTPNSRIMIKSLTLNDKPTCDQYFKRLIALDFPMKQITLCGGRSHEDHLRVYNVVDVGLDPYPYHGTTTTCEALWMGVPVITMAGPSHVSRVGASLLHSVGLSDLVAQNEDEYIEKAFALATDHERLREIRSTLRERMQKSALMDPKIFVPQLEEAFEEMLRRKEHPMARKKISGKKARVRNSG